MATAGEDLAINLWDLGSGKRVKKMMGHNSSIYSLSFSAESSLLVSGGADWTVRCWDVKGAGGLKAKSENGSSSEAGNRPGRGEGSQETFVLSIMNCVSSCSPSHRIDLLSTFPTKRTPITNVQFTPRNLCLAGGVYLSPEQR
jgi:transcription initiation factor TFIID subunit 5